MRSTRPATLSKINDIIESGAIPDRNVLRAAFSAGILEKGSLAKAMGCQPADIISLWDHKNTRRIQGALRACIPDGQ